MDLFEGLPGTGNRVPLGVDQALDLESQLNIAATVETLAGSTFVGLELGKLRLPKTQDIGLDLANPGHVSNLEIETVGDRGLVEGALMGKLCGHDEVEEDTANSVQTLL